MTLLPISRHSRQCRAACDREPKHINSLDFYIFDINFDINLDIESQ